MPDQAVRKHALYLLKDGGAHLGFEQAIADVPEELRGAKVKGITHIPRRLLEHMRICQWDILEFSRNSNHVSPEFPDGRWPVGDAPPASESWDESVENFRDDLPEMIDLVANPSTDVYATIPHGDGQTILREALA